MRHKWNKEKNTCVRCGLIKINMNERKKRFDGSIITYKRTHYFRDGQETINSGCFDNTQLKLFNNE